MLEDFHLRRNERGQAVRELVLLQQFAQQIGALLEKERRLLREFREHHSRIVAGQIRADLEGILAHLGERAEAGEMHEIDAHRPERPLRRDDAAIADESILRVKYARLTRQRRMPDLFDGRVPFDEVHDIGAKTQRDFRTRDRGDFRKARIAPRKCEHLAADVRLEAQDGRSRRDIIIVIRARRFFCGRLGFRRLCRLRSFRGSFFCGLFCGGHGAEDWWAAFYVGKQRMPMAVTMDFSRRTGNEVMQRRKGAKGCRTDRSVSLRGVLEHGGVHRGSTGGPPVVPRDLRGASGVHLRTDGLGCRRDCTGFGRKIDHARRVEPARFSLSLFPRHAGRGAYRPPLPWHLTPLFSTPPH